MTAKDQNVAEPIELHSILKLEVETWAVSMLVIMSPASVPLHCVYLMQLEHIDVDQTPEA